MAKAVICFEIVPAICDPIPTTATVPNKHPSFGSISAEDTTTKRGTIYIPCMENGNPLNEFEKVERLAWAFHKINYPQFGVYVHILRLEEAAYSQMLDLKTKKPTSNKPGKSSEVTSIDKTKLYLKSIKGGKDYLAGIGDIQSFDCGLTKDILLLSFYASSGKDKKKFFVNLSLLGAIELGPHTLPRLVSIMNGALRKTGRYRNFPIPIHLIDEKNTTLKSLTRNDEDLLEQIKNLINIVKKTAKDSSSDDSSKTIAMTPTPSQHSSNNTPKDSSIRSPNSSNESIPAQSVSYQELADTPPLLPTGTPSPQSSQLSQNGEDLLSLQSLSASHSLSPSPSAVQSPYSTFQPAKSKKRRPLDIHKADPRSTKTKKANRR